MTVRESVCVEREGIIKGAEGLVDVKRKGGEIKKRSKRGKEERGVDKRGMWLLYMFLCTPG